MPDPVVNEPPIPVELRPLLLCVTCGVPWADHTREDCSRHSRQPRRCAADHVSTGGCPWHGTLAECRPDPFTGEPCCPDCWGPTRVRRP